MKALKFRRMEAKGLQGQLAKIADSSRGNFLKTKTKFTEVTIVDWLCSIVYAQVLERGTAILSA